VSEQVRYRSTVGRLSDLSVRRRWEPFEEISWDADENVLDPTDPRWELPRWDPLGASEWYLDHGPEDRSGMGLARVAGLLQTGIDFEAVLQQGLLSYVGTLDADDPGRRYAYHEVIEEAKHSMMFAELIRRTPFRPTVDPSAEPRYRLVAGLGAERPFLFFLSALAGETAFDLIQLRSLREWDPHPLLATINRIHRAEEARHLSFAEVTLEAMAARLDERGRRELRLQAPAAVRWTAEQMMVVPQWLQERWGMPSDVAAAVTAGPEHRALLAAGTAPVAALCRRLGIVDDRTQRLWAI
jgi:hypothetical protein